MEFVAKPTTYNGVRFRSRLEARWAAFFDLCGWRWEYEPVDMTAWTPDFILHMPLTDVLVEVKPVDPRKSLSNANEFRKAYDEWENCQVLLLGSAPDKFGIGALLDPPSAAPYRWIDLFQSLLVNDDVRLWREAGNLTQWRGDRARP